MGSVRTVISTMVQYKPGLLDSMRIMTLSVSNIVWVTGVTTRRRQ